MQRLLKKALSIEEAFDIAYARDPPHRGHQLLELLLVANVDGHFHHSTVVIEFRPDGTVLVRTGKVELGQGVLTAFAQIVADELGAPGLILWVSLSASVILLVVRGLKRIRDVELRIYLAAVFACFISFTIVGVSGPTMAGAAFGPFFWFAVGIAAYWFARRGHRPGVISSGTA